jgi:dolichol-phosphate mannosyltransferase
MTQQAPEITVVLPGLNEADNIVALISQVSSGLEPLNRPYEIIFVDDGSTDDTPARLREAGLKFPMLRAIFQRKNYGQSAALLEGFAAARGTLVVTMDSDLQNDPADIPRMIAFLEENGYDLVCGVRKNRMDPGIRKLSSKVANFVRNLILSDGILDAGCAMRVMKRSALKQLPVFRAIHRFIPTVLIIHGYRVGQMPVNHRPREAGISKYGVGNRLWVGIMDLIGLRWYRKRFIHPDRSGDERDLRDEAAPRSAHG